MGYEDDRLLESLPWARHFARCCASKLPGHLDHEDLQSAGVLGYLLAASKYDATRGATFRGYCSARIRWAVIDELRRWDWAPRSVHQNLRRITHVTSNLAEQLDREPTSMELAKALGLKESDLAAYQVHSQPRQLVSLDEMTENTQGDENMSLTERIADPAAARPDAPMLSVEDRRAMLKCLSCLPKTQSTVIALHYLQNVSLRDVARILAVTPSRISQVHHQALGRLKEVWQKNHALA
jgi:RNA polymerase sigma factor for flagellar operon FliA